MHAGLLGDVKEAIAKKTEELDRGLTWATEAARTTVIVGLQMNQDGTPVIGSIRMLSASGGGDAAARQAFEAAKRAIIRCGSRGYDLPQEKYSQWQDIEMTFDPMRSR